MKISRDSKNLIRKRAAAEMQSWAFGSLALLLIGGVSFLLGKYAWISGRILNLIAIVAVVLGVGFLACGYFSTQAKRKAFISFIESFAFGAENTAKTAVLSFPNPMVVVTKGGEIRWYNAEFVELCRRENLFGTQLQEIFPAIRLSSFLSGKKEQQEFSYNGRDFVINGEVGGAPDADGSLTMVGLSFTDISEVTELKRKIEEQKTVVCTAIIDNYDEVFRETPNSNHGALISDIERCIDLWVEKGEGSYRKYERDKFIILFESAKFNLLLNEKFTILNEVKEIDQQNKIPVTLSIGIGASGEDLKENDKLSLAALDMALGRGGDQAVMKTDAGYSFYGAKSLGVEKTTKVKARVVAKSLCSLIDKASNVVIMGHMGADFDSFGAAVGLFRAVMDRNKNPYIAMDREHNNVKEILADLVVQPEYANGIVSYDRIAQIIDRDSLLIIVDTHRPGIVEYPELLNRTDNVVLIDHHRRSEDFIENTILKYHEPYASSTCEMVAEILQYIGDDQGLSVQEAEALYCGIYLDTKGFTFKTGARTFEAAAYLRKMGVDPVGVHKLFRNDLSLYIQKSRVNSMAKVYRDNIAIAVCDEPSKNIQLVVAQAADDLLDINGIEASFVLANIGSKVIISGRSLGAINVQVILEQLGGGGHITIAGAQLENNSLTIAELKLQNAIDDVLFE